MYTPFDLARLIGFLSIAVCSMTYGQTTKDRPYATIVMVRSGNYIGSSCTTTIRLPNQRAFDLSLKSVVRYTIYSQGDIAITAMTDCPASSASPAASRSRQVSINIEHGKVYYIDGSVGRFELSDSLDLAKQLGKIMNVMVQAESLELPIDRASLVDPKKKANAGQCTCFLISKEGFLVTNAHCVEGASKFTVLVNKNGMTRSSKVELVATDPSNDLALLRFVERDTTLGSPQFAFRTSGVEQTERIYALGFPYAEEMGHEIKITEGIISAKSGPNGDISKYQISAALNPGNSGGPLIDENGNLLGVLYAKSTIAESAGYAIKASYLRAFLDNVEGYNGEELTNQLKDLSMSERVKALSEGIWILKVDQ